MGLKTVDKRRINGIKYLIDFRKKQQPLIQKARNENLDMEEFFKKEEIGLTIVQGIIDIFNDNQGEVSLDIRFPSEFLHIFEEDH